MSEIKIPEDILALNYTQAHSEMEKLIEKLDIGGMPVEEIAACIERCCMLGIHCRSILSSIEKRVLLLTSELQKGGEWKNFEEAEDKQDENIPF